LCAYVITTIGGIVLLLLLIFGAVFVFDECGMGMPSVLITVFFVCAPVGVGFMVLDGIKAIVRGRGYE